MSKHLAFKAFLFLVGGLILVFVVLSVAAGFTYRDYKNSSCRTLIEIANNKEKVEYLNKWFLTHGNSEEFKNFFRKEAFFSARNSPTTFEKIELDWDYLGIEKRFASISFNRRLTKNGFGARSISFINGRSAGLVMVFGDLNQLQLSSDEKQHQVLTNENNLYVDCK